MEELIIGLAVIITVLVLGIADIICNYLKNRNK